MPSTPALLPNYEFEVTATELRINQRPEPIKGAVFEMFAPGEGPGYADNVPDDMPYFCVLSKAKEMGVNLIYGTFGGPEQMRTEFFEAMAHLELPVAMGIWFSGEATNYQGVEGDFQHPVFKAHVRGLIETMIDTLHQGLGRDYNQQVLYFNLGNELSDWAVQNTNQLHPEITGYNGVYFSTPPNSNATEAFLAEMADYTKQYETQTYGVSRPVTHTTWPVVSPTLVDTSFLDFVSYNLYSYWPEFVSEHSPGSVTGTAYQGALEELAAVAADKPFLVSEFGSSTAPLSTMSNVRTPQQQAELFSQYWLDISTGPDNVAGGLVFQLVDQWHKNDYLHANDSSSPFSHDDSDSEEWFGVISVNGDIGNPEYTTKPVYQVIQNTWTNEGD
ncbi:hypothetical protein GCM10011369_06580 [Neiella marina]|uniref:Glycoside hydrolase family 2 catalytic domain-containing protein n=2 Tax=Neiella marina TaxID=508461 RepID=A0A8J2U2Q7_9GAMM|nr:hypothetical protein GCM10011369_06580 [Neiella marina]